MATAAQALKHLTVSASSKHTATVIFVHGLGDSGYGWEPVANMLARDSKFSHIKWILPHAPNKFVTANRSSMPAWFDLKSFTDFGPATEDSSGMLESRAALESLIENEITAGLPADRIVFGGFSQGSAMALLTGLTRKGDNLAGIIALSGWLIMREKFQEMISPEAATIPVFWGHGKDDDLVRYKYGEASVEYLQTKLGFKAAAIGSNVGIEFKSYAGLGHSTSVTELKDMSAWLERVLPQNPSAKV